MSYLQHYQRVRNQSTRPSPETESSFQPHLPEQSNPQQIKFTHLKLTTASAQSVINTCNDSVQTLDLSHNRLDAVPLTAPSSLIALNLSKNHIQQLTSPRALYQLIELNLSRNRIKRMLGLAMLVNIQYLDLSHNYIVNVEGLEAMKDLKVLCLNANLIANITSLRPLSYNRALNELDIDENPVSESTDLRVQLSNLLPNLKYLDGDPIRMRPPASAGDRFGYSELSIRLPKRGASMGNSQDNSMLQNTMSIGQLEADTPGYPRGRRIRIQGMEDEDVEELDNYPTENVKRSALPWRNPPNPMPRPWKGKQIFAEQGTAPDPSRSPINYSKRYPSPQHPPPPPPPPLPRDMETASTVYEGSVFDGEEGDQSSWLCPALNRPVATEEPSAMGIGMGWDMDDARSTRSRSQSPSRALRSPHTKTSVMRAQYTADKLKPQPLQVKARFCDGPYSRRKKPDKSEQASSSSVRNADQKPAQDLVVVQADTEDIHEQDVRDGDGGQRHVSPYRRLTNLKQKIAQRFRPPQDEVSAGQQHFAYLKAFPPITDDEDDLADDPTEEEEPKTLYDIARKREAIQQSLQRKLSSSALQLLDGPMMLNYDEQPSPKQRGDDATQPVQYLQYLPPSFFPPPVDYDSGSETITTASKSRYNAPIRDEPMATGLEPLLLASSAMGYNMPESKRISAEIEALKSKQLQTLANLRLVGNEFVPETPIGPFSPLQALANEPVTPSYYQPEPFFPESQPQSRYADDRSVASGVSKGGASVSNSVVQAEIHSIAAAIEDLRNRQRLSLHHLQSI